MTTRTRGARFCQNNLAAAPGASLTVSGALAGFPGANTIDLKRWLKWIPSGTFRVTASNKFLYINDGSDKTVTLTEGTYASGVALASHIQTQLNAVSSNWTASYSTTSYRFTFGRSSGVALFRLTETENAAWDMLGYTTDGDDDMGTGQAADETRIHTSERWRVDLGGAKQCRAFFVIGESDAEFEPSSSGWYRLRADNVEAMLDPGGTPDLDVTLTRENTGIFQFLDHLPNTTYRYWEFEFSDRENPNGPNFAINNIYLGDYVTPLTRNISNGFVRELVDPSRMQVSEGGVMFHSRRRKFWEYSNVSFEFLKASDRTEMERVFVEMGTTTPMFVSLDPLVSVTASLGETTKYMVFHPTLPTITQVRRDYYQIDIKLREVVG